MSSMLNIIIMIGTLLLLLTYLGILFFAATRLRRCPTPAMLVIASVLIAGTLTISSFVVPRFFGPSSGFFAVIHAANTLGHIVSLILMASAAFVQRSRRENQFMEGGQVNTNYSAAHPIDHSAPVVTDNPYEPS